MVSGKPCLRHRTVTDEVGLCPSTALTVPGSSCSQGSPAYHFCPLLLIYTTGP